MARLAEKINARAGLGIRSAARRRVRRARAHHTIDRCALHAPATTSLLNVVDLRFSTIDFQLFALSIANNLSTKSIAIVSFVNWYSAQVPNLNECAHVRMAGHDGPRQLPPLPP